MILQFLFLPLNEAMCYPICFILFIGLFFCSGEKSPESDFSKNPVSPITWKKSGKYLEHKGYKIFYVDEGKGSAILLLHGFPTSSFDWYKIWPTVTKNHRVIAPDFIGFGFSDKPRDYQYSIFDRADIVESVLQKSGITTFHIIAHDVGVSVASELIARYEERNREERKKFSIESVSLLNGGVFPEVHRPRFLQKALASPVGFLVSYFINEKNFRKSFSEVFGKNSQPSDFDLRASWYVIKYNDGNKINDKLMNYIQDRKNNRERLVTALQKTRVPLRLINGIEDPVSGMNLVERYKELIPNPDVVLLEGTGHYPQTENPEGVIRALKEFKRANLDIR